MEKQEYLLLVEDDTDLRELIRLAGEKRSYRMALAENGLEAQKCIRKGEEPDLIILDINMPGMDGFSFCRWLREDYPLIPVIFLSARAEEYDRIIGLEIGGDDYLTKPFSVKELFARVAVSLRRVALYRHAIGPAAGTKVLVDRDVRIHPDSWTCHYQGKEVLLTASEFRILQKLLSNPDIVITREKLAEAAFPEDSYNSGRSMDIHISRIRKKFQRIHREFRSIETVYQVGYKWKS